MDKDVVKKTVYNQLVSKANAIDTNIPSTSELVTKTQYDSDKQDLEKRIEGVDKEVLNTNGLVRDTKYNTKIRVGLQDRIHVVSNLIFVEEKFQGKINSTKVRPFKFRMKLDSTYWIRFSIFCQILYKNSA